MCLLFFSVYISRTNLFVYFFFFARAREHKQSGILPRFFFFFSPILLYKLHSRCQHVLETSIWQCVHKSPLSNKYIIQSWCMVCSMYQVSSSYRLFALGRRAVHEDTRFLVSYLCIYAFSFVLSTLDSSIFCHRFASYRIVLREHSRCKLCLAGGSMSLADLSSRFKGCCQNDNRCTASD